MIMRIKNLFLFLMIPVIWDQRIFGVGMMSSQEYSVTFVS